MQTEIQRYTRTAQWLHWIMALIIVAVWILGFYMADLPRGPDKTALIQWHKVIGSTVIVWMAIRLAWRATHQPPALPDSMPVWQQKTVHGVHWLLYALMFAQPFSGWAMSSARGFPVALGGVVQLPALLAKDENLAKVLTGLHEAMGWVLAALVVGHVAMALKHHFIDRDAVLLRMLPWKH
jgi:cytochrome b561